MLRLLTYLQDAIATILHLAPLTGIEPVYVWLQIQLATKRVQGIIGAVDGNRTRLGLIDSEVPSQRVTTAYWYSVRESNPPSQVESLVT